MGAFVSAPTPETVTMATNDDGTTVPIDPSGKMVALVKKVNEEAWSMGDASTDGPGIKCWYSARCPVDGCSTYKKARLWSMKSPGHVRCYSESDHN